MASALDQISAGMRSLLGRHVAIFRQAQWDGSDGLRAFPRDLPGEEFLVTIEGEGLGLETRSAWRRLPSVESAWDEINSLGRRAFAGVGIAPLPVGPPVTRETSDWGVRIIDPSVPASTAQIAHLIGDAFGSDVTIVSRLDAHTGAPFIEFFGREREQLRVRLYDRGDMVNLEADWELDDEATAQHVPVAVAFDWLRAAGSHGAVHFETRLRLGAYSLRWAPATMVGLISSNDRETVVHRSLPWTVGA